MSWVGVSIGGIGAGLGAYGSFRSAQNRANNSGFDINPYGALTPEQRSLMGELGPLLEARSKNANLYGGQLSTGLTDLEKENVARFGRLGALGEDTFSNLLSGKFDEQEFQKGVIAPTVADYKQYIQPLIDESFAGPGGGFYGSARGEANRRSGTDLARGFAGQRYAGQQQARTNALAAGQIAPGFFSSISQGIALPRVIKQYGLDRQYNEWVRGEKQKQDYVNAALNFMNISGGTAIPRTASPDPWAYLLQGGGNMLQMAGMLRGLAGLGSGASAPTLGNLTSV